MTDDIAKITIRKLYIRIVPFIMIMYFVAFIDRINVGFAALQMNKDLGFSSAVYGFGAGIFFIGYVLFEVPSNLILHKVGARIWIARIMITWGIISGAMALVQGPISFYVLRFLLGVAEAGFFPGIILYISYWFPSDQRAGVTAFFMMAAPLATVLGSPISGALLEMDGVLGLAGWQWLFLVEAAPAILLAGVVLMWLRDKPEKAKWLNEDEKIWLRNRLDEESEQKKQVHERSEWFSGLTDPRVLSLGLIYFGTSAALYTATMWGPQIIKEYDVADFEVGLLNALPPILGVLVMVIWARHSDRTGERTWHVAGACLLAALGLLYLGAATTLVGALAGLACVYVGVTSCKPPLWGIPTIFLSGSAAASGIAAINSIGNLGGFVGPFMIGWIRDLGGGLLGGTYFVAGLLAMSAVIMVILGYRYKFSR